MAGSLAAMEFPLHMETAHPSLHEEILTAHGLVTLPNHEMQHNDREHPRAWHSYRRYTCLPEPESEPETESVPDATSSSDESTAWPALDNFSAMDPRDTDERVDVAAWDDVGRRFARAFDACAEEDDDEDYIDVKWSKVGSQFAKVLAAFDQEDC
mmetsp:Transcript_16382/g.38419  ORF Transcript_16382/g.38419 Transcript_16382/m.38419 type:complete len:155 (-) Transcript_16382:174-638(-)|eukprot:CAMPEP_0171106098 /NCGR_PEP_ID=MMETSP0766_2-20121228/64046_1 /TAXON_ID=439317 /ORGANISM="Gambierdiscus australes, Strain CAWD 149" /LENGTH=154 /DNA_ID=CAMNT_0011567105 /DNA_START=66 /DNA_END=530 /DNA_ORIENTATION=+